MRENPKMKEGTIPAKHARIFWDARENKVAVLTEGQKLTPEIDAYESSGGACWAKWRKACEDDKIAQVLCLKAFWDLVYIWDMDPEVVDEALSDIIEYQKAFEHDYLDMFLND